ncbi:MAG: type 3 dihydrofolate reductase [Woeseiaceae bacterium]|nr:type 3 dihydrofolate reductase [Woeseiaceae bacterium]
MKISLIVAASANGVIGARGELPWHLPDDFAHFKAVTMGKSIVMGRKTWESIGRALPGRSNIVVTRQAGYEAQGAVVVDSIDRALAVEEADEIMIIGGGQLYAELLPRADRVYLTHVDTELDGDTFFPPLDDRDWELVSAEPHAADDRHAYAFEIRQYDRR